MKTSDPEFLKAVGQYFYDLANDYADSYQTGCTMEKGDDLFIELRRSPEGWGQAVVAAYNKAYQDASLGVFKSWKERYRDMILTAHPKNQTNEARGGLSLGMVDDPLMVEKDNIDKFPDLVFKVLREAGRDLTNVELYIPLVCDTLIRQHVIEIGGVVASNQYQRDGIFRDLKMNTSHFDEIPYYNLKKGETHMEVYALVFSDGTLEPEGLGLIWATFQ